MRYALAAIGLSLIVSCSAEDEPTRSQPDVTFDAVTLWEDTICDEYRELCGAPRSTVEDTFDAACELNRLYGDDFDTMSDDLAVMIATGEISSYDAERMAFGAGAMVAVVATFGTCAR